MNNIRSKIPLSQILVELCVAKGIEHVVISPGSRNAPLTIGFANHPRIHAYSVVDERSAAFFALGMAQQIRKPVAVVCTSGSALLNYYPAVAEAFYSDIPLLVISADRPEHLIDVGDGQTIRQPNVFQNHILYSANLKSAAKNELSENDQVFNEAEINLALNFAFGKNGPVHINVPFDEPLYEKTETALQVSEQQPPQTKAFDFEVSETENFIKNWNSAERKIILVGVNFPKEIDQKYLDFFAEDKSVLVFTETTSNLHHPDFFPNIDTIIAPIEKDKTPDKYFKKLQPDLLLTFGGMVVSKKVKAFLRNYPPEKHFHINSKKAYDTFFCLTQHFEVSPNQFFNVVLPKLQSGKSDYREFWDKVKIHRKKKRTEYLEQIPFSDFMVFDAIFKQVPPNEMLQIGNSSAIRYAQLFDLDKSLSVFCNRGTSGIEGSVSTAVGAALASKNPTTLITGDLSFFYDSNGLWNNYIPKNFKIIIINNGGGGIFRILPGDKTANYFEKFFETPHELNAEPLAKMFGVEYSPVLNENELASKVEAFFSKKNNQILEIFTPREINDEVLLGYFEFIK
ncbi:MAG TPA: 2-succinyl-5-enolpyruvyl-6-hydroxy-3-cyclohexene-1-carboxylic-acid synthase [Flavobacteriaceae bacterium]|nr:2-succinyl-5-enolpyruvyl-6-hydroxy-3-cyclohexene-1-carboxylic-acid synthase [Flavobacteriaceae bacterium]